MKIIGIRIYVVFNNNGDNEITRDNRKTIIFGVLNYKKPSFWIYADF